MLDIVFDNGGYDECLSEGQWNFAMRAVQIDYDTNITPSFGYKRAFTKPSDWILWAIRLSLWLKVIGLKADKGVETGEMAVTLQA